MENEKPALETGLLKSIKPEPTGCYAVNILRNVGDLDAFFERVNATEHEVVLTPFRIKQNKKQKRLAKIKRFFPAAAIIGLTSSAIILNVLL